MFVWTLGSVCLAPILTSSAKASKLPNLFVSLFTYL